MCLPLGYDPHGPYDEHPAVPVQNDLGAPIYRDVTLVVFGLIDQVYDFPESGLICQGFFRVIQLAPARKWIEYLRNV